ncbi:putative ankyrin repeat domain-containing protein 50 [Rosellinia necatrix]|uniref:Putative ankyrin repeat domain-containing protein 50 n=1 Tax=Rosellinia necatrix TaxID=77044 RepID=A0A1S7UL38_ROSNE|nr:putative ankyrin repeat domain-containing protein 50 [Rosellinia necatrix]
MLISEILDLQATCAVNIFATSRFIPGITERFEHASKLEIRASKQDVCTYIDNHMLHLPSFVKRDGELQDEIKNEIFKAADGMFLLAKLHLDSLIGKRSLKAVRQALKILPSGSNALHQAYRDAMSRIESQVPDQIELAKQVLLWISCSKRPLTTSELQHALAVEVGKDEIDPENFPHVEDMVSACAGLVTVDEQSKIVRLVHHTTQEFFEQMQTHWFPNAHNDIATVCITYLSFSVFDAGFCQSESECEESLLLNSLYDYAAHHWGHHARAAAIETSDLVLEFLQSEPKVSSQTVARLVTGMHLAAYFGLRDTVVALLAIGNEPDPWDTDGRTPLSYAAARGHEAVVALLLANKSMSPDSKDLVHGWTPLWHAVVGAQVAVVKLLLDNDAIDPNCISHHGRTPLSWAAEKGCDAIVSLLVDNEQVHLNAIDPECGWTPLCWAAGNGHHEVIKLLLGKPEVNPNAKDIEYGRTALSWAAERGHKAAVKALVTANQVELNSKSKYGRTPLWFAKERGHREIVDLLLSHNAVDPCLEYSEYGQIPLWYAAEIGHEATVKLLLDSGGHPNMKSEFGRTPLSHAAERGHEVIVRLLLGDGKADPDIKDSVYERTPLSWAAANGHESVVKLLLQQKSVKPDSKSKHGTPLSWAARFGHEAAVRLLLAKDNVNPDSKCHCQRTPLSYAAEKGHEAIVKLLLGRSEVNPSSKDSKYGRTPLSWARVNRQEAIVKLLNENC